MSARLRRRRPRGVTLVELLVVTAIIATLLAILVPVLQVARESARQAQCSNNLRQIGIAVQSHEQSQGAYPTGGRRYLQSTRTKLGGTPASFATQVWSWPYQILPYMEQEPLWSGTSDDVVAATPVPGYFCPTRRPPTVLKGGVWANTTKSRAMIDYAGNAGTISTTGDWPQTGEIFGGGEDGVFASAASAVVVRRPGQIRDGLDMTLLAGEKRMNAQICTTQTQPDDNDGYIGGFQSDVVRWGAKGTGWGDIVPYPDTRESALDPTTVTREQLYPWIGSFGSSHMAGTVFVTCDGTIRVIGFTVDPEVFQFLCGIRDGKYVDWTTL